MTSEEFVCYFCIYKIAGKEYIKFYLGFANYSLAGHNKPNFKGLKA